VEVMGRYAETPEVPDPRDLGVPALAFHDGIVTPEEQPTAAAVASQGVEIFIQADIAQAIKSIQRIDGPGAFQLGSDLLIEKIQAGLIIMIKGQQHFNSRYVIS